MNLDDDKLPLSDFRGPLPLTDADFDAIRGKVLGRIATGKRRWLAGLALRLAFATIAIFVVAISMIVIARRPEAPPEVVASVRKAPAVALPTPAPAGHAAAETIAVEPQHVAAAAPRPPVRRHPAAHAAAAATPLSIAAQEPLTIQLQTSNPDVRIIWIAR